MELYVFPGTAGDIKGRAKLDIDREGRLHYSLGAGRVVIDPSVMRDGSSAMTLYRDGALYVLYNFREILQVMNLTPHEFLSSLGIHGLLQADKSGWNLYVKAFLPYGQETLDSDTDDFSALSHMTADMIHPLDWSYTWTVEERAAEVKDGTLSVTLAIRKSEFRKREIWLSHGGQAVRAEPGGVRTYTFRYVPGEDVYLGEPYSRYKGRTLDLDRLLKETEGGGG